MDPDQLASLLNSVDPDQLASEGLGMVFPQPSIQQYFMSYGFAEMTLQTMQHEVTSHVFF